MKLQKTVGMDIESAKTLASKAEQNAEIIIRIIEFMDLALHNPNWAGSDLQDLQNSWHSIYKPNLRNAIISLKKMQESAIQNREEQIFASGGSGQFVSNNAGSGFATNLIATLAGGNNQGEIQPGSYFPSIAQDERIYYLTQINKWRQDKGQPSLNEGDIPDISALLLQMGMAYQTGGNEASGIQIIRKNSEIPAYTIIFPATTAGGILDWDTGNMNNWGSNLHAINQKSALVPMAWEILKEQMKNDGADFEKSPIMTAGFSQGGILAADFAQKYQNELNIKQVVTQGSPVGGFTEIGEKVNVIAFENSNPIPFKGDFIPYLDTPYEAGILGINAAGGILASFGTGIKAKIPGKNPTTKNWQTVKTQTIDQGVLGKLSSDSVAPGHDPGNYAFGSLEAELNSENNLELFLGSGEQISSNYRYVKAKN